MSIKTELELLPNEVFIECFQYLNAPDLFYAFDQLNYRFYSLIRNSPLNQTKHYGQVESFLSLIDLKDNDVDQEQRILKIMPALLKSTIRILTQPDINFNLPSVYETMSIVSLTLLSYLNIKYFDDHQIPVDELNFNNTKAVYLKELKN